MIFLLGLILGAVGAIVGMHYLKKEDKAATAATEPPKT